MVLDFFNGNSIPKYFTLTFIVLILKKNISKVWSDFRLIISKILALRLGPLLLSLISPNQSNFVRDRLIFDNILNLFKKLCMILILIQEVVTWFLNLIFQKFMIISHRNFYIMRYLSLVFSKNWRMFGSLFCLMAMEYFSKCINAIFETNPSMYYITRDGFPISYLCFMAY
ncbi:hypothetical protein M5K25_008370 [Dendrobium thyrsiflorum]|uniref:Uncharacterized protein n=1 Tax=Dendrobium thyrsiflorum TaxID=117978 RepID=A0ABD0V8J2_DENTH